MKTLFKILLLIVVTQSNAQFLDRLAKKAEEAAKRTVERKVEEKTEKTTDKTVDKVLNPEKKSSSSSDSDSGSTKSKKSGKSAKSAKDFVPGNKVLATEDFSQDAIGDFPVNWSTNSSGEVVTFDKSDTKWLQLSDRGDFSPNHITKLPENFTFEFDLYASDDFSFYSTWFTVVFAASKKKTDYTKWGEFQKGSEGVMLGLHPQMAGNKAEGGTAFTVISNGAELMKNEIATESFTKNNSTARVQIWRQKGRLRAYVNGSKVWDIPSAFQDANYNSIVFYIAGYNDKNDKYYISNLRLAEAGADTRHKLIETGTFTTNEILFDTNKASIKSSSAAVLADLGNALKENPKVKVNIIGHTDGDGNENDNQKLSEQRAESVKKYLSKNFDIELDRMSTSGKGESAPIADNKTEEGKKQNRRVEFKVIK